MQFDLFDQGADSQPGARQTDLEMIIEEQKMNAEERHVAGFQKRVDRAAAHIAANRPITRALDNCFENYDGNAVAHALFRRAAKNPNGALAQNISKYLSGEVNEAAWANGPSMTLAELREMSRQYFRQATKQ